MHATGGCRIDAATRDLGLAQPLIGPAVTQKPPSTPGAAGNEASATQGKGASGIRYQSLDKSSAALEKRRNPVIWFGGGSVTSPGGDGGRFLGTVGSFPGCLSMSDTHAV